MADFDLCVIGGGPAGFAAAMRAWDFGKRVCIVEKGALGGVGVHNGALSSKTLWELSRDYRKALVRDRGFVARDVELDYGAVIQCVEKAISEKVGQLPRQLTGHREDEVLFSRAMRTPGAVIVPAVAGVQHDDIEAVRLGGTRRGPRNPEREHPSQNSAPNPTESPLHSDLRNRSVA